MSVMFHFFGICNKKNFDTSPFQMCVSESVYVRVKMSRIQDNWIQVRRRIGSSFTNNVKIPEYRRKIDLEDKATVPLAALDVLPRSF